MNLLEILHEADCKCHVNVKQGISSLYSDLDKFIKTSENRTAALNKVFESEPNYHMHVLLSILILTRGLRHETKYAEFREKVREKFKSEGRNVEELMYGFD